jgi:hypothetical protein
MTRSTAKTIARTVIGMSVGYTVTTAINNNLPEDESKLKKLEALIGGAVVAAMVREQAGAYTDKKIDAIADRWWNQGRIKTAK